MAPRVPGRLEAVSQQAEGAQEMGPGLQEDQHQDWAML